MVTRKESREYVALATLSRVCGLYFDSNLSLQKDSLVRPMVHECLSRIISEDGINYVPTIRMRDMEVEKAGDGLLKCTMFEPLKRNLDAIIGQGSHTSLYKAVICGLHDRSYDEYWDFVQWVFQRADGLQSHRDMILRWFDLSVPMVPHSYDDFDTVVCQMVANARQKSLLEVVNHLNEIADKRWPGCHYVMDVNNTLFHFYDWYRQEHGGM